MSERPLMDNTKNSQNVRRSLRMLLVLQGNSFRGLRLKQVAEAVQASPSTTLRDLEVLADEGFVERIPGNDEFWRLTPRVVQIARAHEEELSRLHHQVSEFNQRFTRLPK